MIRHAAYLLNRYAVHSDCQTSFQRRWGEDHKAPLCEMAETVRYMIPTLRAQPKLEPRFFKEIWLGRDTMTGEPFIGIPGKIIRVRTIRRQICPDKYDGQLLDTLNVHPQTLQVHAPQAYRPTTWECSAMRTMYLSYNLVATG